MRALNYAICLILFLVSCNSEVSKGDKEKMQEWKSEIRQTEADFASMVKHEGIPKAFLNYADEDAVLLRNDKIIEGKKAIAQYFDERKNSHKISLTWEPNFIEVSSSGDLAYTYGEYVFTIIDSTGEENSSTGIFHTVWKRQPDGKWKFVWD